MTSKIASEVLKASSIKQMGFCKVIVDGKSFSVKEALDTAIKALEQEPCEDAISRQEALNVVHKYFEHYLQLNDDICLDGLRSLPSVTPKEKTGEWIDDADKIDSQYGKNSYKCSKCGKYAEYFISGTELWRDRIKPNYCPNCGIKMVEIEESEGSE